MNFKDIRKQNIEKTKQDLKQVDSDVFVIQAINNVAELGKILNILNARLREWAGWQDIELPKKSNLAEVVVNKKISGIIPLAKLIIETQKSKEKQEAFISKKLGELSPNFVAIVPPLLAGKILSQARSLKHLMELPASTIQLLGAEKALFRHLVTGSKSPKYGLIFDHPLVQKAKNKGKAARLIAEKIALAIKVDYFNGDFIGDKLLKQLESKIETSESATVKEGRESKSRLIKLVPNLFSIKKNLFCTTNLNPGSDVYGEKLVKDNENNECRVFDPHRSKLAAAIAKGYKLDLDEDSKVLYLGASTGTTVSHVSDIVKKGFVFAVDNAKRVVRELLFLAEQRSNIAPILESASHPEKYKNRILKVNWVYQDVAARDQVEMFLKNVDLFLESGTAVLCLKTRSVDISKKPRDVIDDAEKHLSKSLSIIQKINIEPYYKDHCVFVCKK